MFAPAGFEQGYDQLLAESEEVELLAGTVTRVASLRAIITSKEAA
jgi:hypothetical protein